MHVTTQGEVDLLKEVLAHFNHEPSSSGREVRLTHVLRAYEAVLKRAPLNPVDDTFFHRYCAKFLAAVL